VFHKTKLHGNVRWNQSSTVWFCSADKRRSRGVYWSILHPARDDRTGKTVPRKVGLAPVMRDGIEYEFDVCGEMDQDNTLQITKSRCPKLSGGVFQKPGRELADALKEWLGTAPDPEPKLASAAPVTGLEQNNGGRLVNGVGERPSLAVLTEELAAIWKRMCSPRGVMNEFAELKKAIEELAGPAGVTEYYRVLREHGTEHPRQFRSMQPARLCAKDVYVLLEQLRSNVRDKEQQPDLGPAPKPVAAETVGRASELWQTS